MTFTVYEGTRAIGELSIEACGLYYEIRCSIEGQGALRRLYGIRERESTYLGIPDGTGKLCRRIPRKNFNLPEWVIASSAEPGPWRPWCGNSFGPELKDCFLRSIDNGWLLAIGQDELENLPEWKGKGNIETVAGRPMICLQFDLSGQPPQKEIEIGGERNEVHTQIHSNDIDPLLLADLPADYDYGGTGTEEAHSDHL
ncbi:MAG: hypothetical protein IKM59_02365 [Oscillospiraceae bacterium]|nr:hypothetical protein [Oscillospiraceae bacterium]